jgi:hypothetical protein
MYRVIVLLLLAALSLGVVACSTPLTQQQAQEKAVAAFTADEELEGAPEDVMVLEATETTRSGSRGWDFRLSGVIILPGLADGMLATETVFVTIDDGATTIIDRG